MMAFFGLLYLLPIAWSLGVQDGAVIDFVRGRADQRLRGPGGRDRDATLPPRAQAARRFPAGDAVLGADVGLGRDSAHDRAAGSVASPTRTSRPMSGLTTTGSTVLNHLDDLPQSINLWRHTLHWIGGIGIIVLVVAVLPLLGVGGMQLYKAETPGPVKDEKLTPRITETAKALWFTYLAITVVGHRRAAHRRHELVRRHLPLLLGDRARRLFHARRERRAIFDSFAIELVLIVIMVVGGDQFLASFPGVSQRCRCGPTATDSEGKAVLIVLGGSVVLVTALLWVDGTYPGFAEVAAAFGLQRGLDRDHHRLRHRGLREVAGVPAGVAAVPELHHLQHGLHRRRHQDVPHAAAGAPGAPRAQTTGASQRRDPDPHRRRRRFPTAWPTRCWPSSSCTSARSWCSRSRCWPPAWIWCPRSRRSWARSTTWARDWARSARRSTSSRCRDVQTWICTVAMIIGRLEIFSVLVLFTADVLAQVAWTDQAACSFIPGAISIDAAYSTCSTRRGFWEMLFDDA